MHDTVVCTNAKRVTPALSRLNRVGEFVAAALPIVT